VTLASGTYLGRYEILSPLGSGGMGEVYAARDPRLDRRVAIKISKAQFSERFEREARAAAALIASDYQSYHNAGIFLSSRAA